MPSRNRITIDYKCSLSLYMSPVKILIPKQSVDITGNKHYVILPKIILDYDMIYAMLKLKITNNLTIY